jgi:hypothetical protein
MPYEDPDPTDPMTRHGVAVEVSDDGATREMAECFVEEFVRLGFDEPRLLRMFRSPGYAGPHRAWRRLGDAAIRAIVKEELGRRRHAPTRDAALSCADTWIGLPVLQ